MSEQRIILANGSRLLHEMLNRILVKTEHLDVVQEISDHNNLPASIEQQDAEWLIMSQPTDGKIPEWTNTYLQEHPLVRIMTVASDGSWIKMKWLEKHEENFTGLSLQELIHILESNPGHI